MKLGVIDFPNEVVDALRDDRLVVLAGAGVSIGAPSNMPSFGELVDAIAQGTGESPGEKEPPDRFLGRLGDGRKVDVHTTAARALSGNQGAPNDLHRALARLFREAGRMRVVTTNFEFLIEAAAEEALGQRPRSFEAPAIPVGSDFRGVVHIHGGLSDPHTMVLTDADFGRAYLLEGWARRFLVSLFRHFTVLFVGYSHQDAVVNYLARAIPATGAYGRYALMEVTEDSPTRWDLLGVTAIPYKKQPNEDNPHQRLYDGVGKLAQHASRGALEWRTQLNEIAEAGPPQDAESVGQIDHALTEFHLTRFLLETATHSEWPRWLNERGYLDSLFDQPALSEQAQELAAWLANTYATANASVIFSLLERHGAQLNPALWQALVLALYREDRNAYSAELLSQWVSLLVAAAPRQIDHHLMTFLAERCTDKGLLHSVLDIWALLVTPRLHLRRRVAVDGSVGGTVAVAGEVRRLSTEYALTELWEQRLKPHLSEFAEEVLRVSIPALEASHRTLACWSQADRGGDPETWHRSAIEHHEQDELREPVDAVIDSARDALESLSAANYEGGKRWVLQLLDSNAPLLRRLAAHALSTLTQMSSDDRLQLLLKTTGLHEVSTHHEVYRLARLSYPEAGQKTRRDVLDAIASYQWPDPDDKNAETLGARVRFNWLHWLYESVPDCVETKRELDALWKAFPEWQPQEHPDLTFWMSSGWVGDRSPWSSEELLNSPAEAWVNNLLEFRGEGLLGPNREGLLAAVSNAVQENFYWSLDLATALSNKSRWQTDLWRAILRGWHRADLQMEDWGNVIQWLEMRELQCADPQGVADLLRRLVEDAKPIAARFQTRTNSIARQLWSSCDEPVPGNRPDDWFAKALNSLAGTLAQYWLHSIAVYRQHVNEGGEGLPLEHRNALTTVAEDESVAGAYARSILANQLLFLFKNDTEWTTEQLLPCFLPTAGEDCLHQAWDGFLAGARVNPKLAEAMEPAFREGIRALDGLLAERSEGFTRVLTLLLIYHLNDPLQDWVPEFFQHASLEDRGTFADQLGRLLRQMENLARRELWGRWLREYWERRLMAIPRPIDDAELRHMWEWPLHMGDLFPHAVDVAVRMRRIPMDRALIPHTLVDSEYLQQYPDEVARYLVELVRAGLPRWECGDLRKIAQRLDELGAAPENRAALAEQMARMGCT
ncbi:SIR2 family protein [Spiribacter halobius]|uniref:DUF4020 domain-containing protein n=1 Tax=Sediminicurvatus halobius TaxID=2182432 RepID=A0A2U2MVQ4_9GAMM|nr:SIR2 family protein [Spiribacter halobius]PWG60930.1 hypothetical protein DEM34_19080 [Spiribacter halobius]UEX76931.1 DUF4020 domain-containing protein [Spiribacter halobius]